MKTKVLYTIISILSLLSGMAMTFLVVVIIANIPGAAAKGKWAELSRVFPNIFGFLVATTVLYAIWDIGTRLIRIEQAQESLRREMRNKQDSVV